MDASLSHTHTHTHTHQKVHSDEVPAKAIAERLQHLYLKILIGSQTGGQTGNL